MQSTSAPATVSQPAEVTNRRVLIGVFIVVVFLYWMGLYLYYPTLPSYIKTRTNDLSMVGTVLSMYGLWQAIIRLPVGVAEDWIGRRKPFLIGGLALVGVGAFVLGTAGSINTMLVGRAITGMAAATWVPLVVIFSSLFPHEEAVRATGILTVVGSASRMLANGLTGFINQASHGYAMAFFLATAMAVLAILFALPTPDRQREPVKATPSSFWRILRNRSVLIPTLLNTVAQHATWATVSSFILIQAKNFGASDVSQSLLATLNAGLYTVGNLLATMIVRRTGTRSLVLVSFILLAAGIGVAAVAPSLPLIFVATFIIGLSSGINYPILMGMSIVNVAESERNTAMGLHQAIYGIGMFSGPWLGGLLAQQLGGVQPMFAITAVGTLLFGLVGVIFLKLRPIQGDLSQAAG
jgi:MFS family permease